MACACKSRWAWAAAALALGCGPARATSTGVAPDATADAVVADAPTAPADPDAVADAPPDLAPDAAGNAPVDAASDAPAAACSAASPQGCFAKPKATACPTTAAGESQQCVQNSSADGCIPFVCQCDAATGQWQCDPSCGGGICKPLCQVLAPTVHCCQDGQYAKPDCKDGVFSCPAGSYAKPLAGCGPYAGTATPGQVSCPKGAQAYELCPDGYGCCFGVVTQCWQAESLGKSCYAAVACDDHQDCGGGAICCVVKSDGYAGTACVAPADCQGQGNYRVCQADADCQPGKVCCDKAQGGKYGVCLEAPC